MPENNKVWKRLENLEILDLDDCHLTFQFSHDKVDLLAALYYCKNLKRISLKGINFEAGNNMDTIQYLQKNLEITFRYYHKQCETILWDTITTI
jgi:hypothetical protein